MRKKNTDDMTVREILEYISETMCDNYCKHRENADKKIKLISDPDKWGDKQVIFDELTAHCKECPLSRL